MKKILILFITSFFIIACSNDNTVEPMGENDSLELTKLSSRGITDQQPADQAKEFLSHYDEISGVRAVNHDGALMIAVKVKQLERFNLEDIEEALEQDIRKNFSKMKVKLSTDEKIYLELKRLEEDLLGQNISNKEVKKRLKKIQQLSKEET